MTVQQWLYFIKGLIEECAPAIAVALWNYQEGRIDHAIKEKEAAELATKNLQDAQAIADKFKGVSDIDIIHSLDGTSPDPNRTKPE